MKKYFSKYIPLYISLLISLILLGMCIIWANKKNDVKTVIERNVISARYDDGFIVVEEEDEETNISRIKRYEIDRVNIIDIKEKKPYIKKYFNRNGKLLVIELFYSEGIL